MEKKYFVEVVASDRRQLQRLGDYDVDLFRQTAKASLQTTTLLKAASKTTELNAFEMGDRVDESRQLSIEGALSLEDIGRLVDDGYVVVVRENAAVRTAPARETIGAEEWLKEMGFEQ
jgi:hypothetical protein